MPRLTDEQKRENAITFVVPGVPVAQPRQRHRIVNAGDRSFTQNYTPANHPVQTFKAVAIIEARRATHGRTFTGPLMVWATFVMPRPKAMMWKKRAMPRTWDTRRKDVDNLFKSLADALTTAGIWKDDSQVVWLDARKVIASGDEQPHVLVRITSLETIDEP